MKVTRHKNGTGATPTCGRRRRRTALIETPGDFTGEKLKVYNFVIPGCVKPLQMLKRNSGYDSHDAISPFSPPSSLRLLPF